MIRNTFSFTYVFLVLILLLILITSFANAQDVNSNKEEKFKTSEILLNARKAIGLSTEKLNVQKISLVFNVSVVSKIFIVERNEKRETEQSGEREFYTTLPNKFRYLESMKIEDTNWINNFILNGNLLDIENYGVSQGQQYENDPSALGNQTEEQMVSEKKEEIFYILFPILLESSDFFPLEFKYIGKAELNEEKADVLEAVLSEESKVKLFFDETTHLLKLLITENKLQNGAEFKEKRYYSDYKTVDGLKIANKINVEIRKSSKRITSESFEEQILKSAKINPTFKPNFFEVKKK